MMKKLNNRGYITSLTIVSVMLGSLLFLSLFYSVIQTRNVQIKISENLTTQMVYQRTIYDRLYGVFNNDFTRTDDISFEDLELTYTVDIISSHDGTRVLKLEAIEQPSDEKNVPTIIYIEINQLSNPSLETHSKKIEFKILS